jgi:hypothetical protein
MFRNVGCRVLVVVLAGCGSVKSPGTAVDAGSPGSDAGSPGGDAGSGSPDAGAPDAALACAPSTTSCTADLLTVCGSDGQVMHSETCSLGCTTAGDACLKLDPSNGLASALDGAAATGPAVLFDASTTATTINTDTGAVMHNGVAVTIPSVVVIQPGLPNLRAFQVKSLVVQNPVTVSGAAALAFVSDGDVTISSTITLAGRGLAPGPGAVVDHATACSGRDITISNQVAPGPGGAGFGTAGAAGGAANGNVGGSPGTVAGADTLVPLRGGCVGGFVTGSGSIAGAGGGALQVSSRTKITVTVAGVVDAGGGGGAFFLVGGAGGSGGGILLEAPVVAVGGTLAANGGGGACGATAGEDGRTTPRAGSASGLAALGGVCSDPSQGNGGNGGTKDAAPRAGASVTNASTAIGGGGGGSVGRIRVNTRTGTFTQTSALISPVASQGTAHTR